MTDITTATVPEGQIKVRWREPYVSEGVNTALGVLDPGVYRGGYVTATSPATQAILIDLGGEADSSYLWQDLTTGVALAIRYTAAVTLNCSTAFPIPGGGLTLYVYLNATYATSATTTATFTVADAAAASANAIPLATITVPFGATTITAAMINVGPAARQAVALERPILQRATASFLPAGSPLAFQVTGQVFASGENALGYVRAVHATYRQWPYVGSDGGTYPLTGPWDSAACSSPAVADSEGFVTNPYYGVDLTLSTDATPPSGQICYWTRATARDLDLADDFHGYAEAPPVHAQELFARAEAGSPTALTTDSVQAQLAQLLAAVNARVASMAPTAAPSGPVLLWRSHAIATDGAVTGTTTSLYWGTALGLAMVTGAYISGGTIYEATVSPADAVSMVRVSANAQASCGLFTKANGFTSLAWDTMASWDSYIRNGELAGNRLWDIASTLWLNNGAVLLGTTSTLGLTNHNNYLYGNRPNTGGIKKYCRLFESAAFAAAGIPRLRLFYGDAGTFIVTSNAGWEQPLTVGAWIGDDATVDAFALVFNHGGLALWRRDKDVGDGTILWFDAGEGIETWHSVMTWGVSATNSMTAYPVAAGTIFDRVRMCVTCDLEDGGSPHRHTGFGAATWHTGITGAGATHVSATWISSDPTNTGAGSDWVATVISADPYGALIKVQNGDMVASTIPYWYGDVTVTH
jgi:hypothetical protein